MFLPAGVSFLPFAPLPSTYTSSHPTTCYNTFARPSPGNLSESVRTLRREHSCNRCVHLRCNSVQRNENTYCYFAKSDYR